MHALENRFGKAWEPFQKRLDAERPLLVAVSGGVDSVVLLHLLTQKVSPNALVVVYFDHQTRAATKKEALWVKKLAYSLGVKKVVLGKRKTNRLSEEALRKERYAFFEKVQKKTRAQATVLAHHADDQLETLLMRLIRGTRMEGLGSMKKVQGTLLRPLLTFTKKELLQYSKDRQIAFLEDETNQSPQFFRNRVRAQVVPAFKKLTEEFGGQEKFFERLTALLDEIQSFREESKEEAAKWISQHVEKTSCWWLFSLKEWANVPLFLQKAIAESLFWELGKETLETKEIKQLKKAILQKSRTILSGNIEVISSFGKVYLISPAHRDQQKRVLKKGPLLCVKNSTERRALQKRLHTQGLELRFLKAGDTFQGKKMKRRCWEEKIPSVDRQFLPVLAKPQSSEVEWYSPVISIT